MRFNWLIGTRHRGLVLAAAIILLLAVTYADWATGPELSLTIFYVAPIALAALVGARPGVVVAVLAAVGWFGADAFANATYAQPLVPYWNALIQLLLYLLVVAFISALQRSRLLQQELMEFIVHDLRTPLTAIRAALKSCSLPGQFPEEQVGRVMHAGSNSLDRVTNMVNDLLDVARAEGTGLKVSLQPVEAGALVTAAVEQVRPWASDLEVGVEAVIAAPLPLMLADPSLTTRVVVNLLGNAIKYSPERTTVTASVLSPDPRHVLLSVTDHGPGVPAEWLKRVFGKFEQVEARKTGVAAGTGLGLAFCQMAVAAQGGRIWMESEPNVKTTVSFTLPVA